MHLRLDLRLVQTAAGAQKKAVSETAGRPVEKPVEGTGALTTSEQNPDVQIVEKKAEKPFWKFWQK